MNAKDHPDTHEAPVYRQPPDTMKAIADAPRQPEVVLDPCRRIALVMQPEPAPSIAKLAKPQARLAGLRFNPDTRSLVNAQQFVSLSFKPLDGAAEYAAKGLPDGSALGMPRWSPDGRRVAVPVTGDNGVSLWIVEADTGMARQAGSSSLNRIFEPGFRWMPDSERLICCLRPEPLPPAPEPDPAPTGPLAQETAGEAAPVRTYQDLLKTPFDARLFAHFATSQLAIVGCDGSVAPMGPEGLYTRAAPSPDGRFLLVERMTPPFSYLVPWPRFPRRVMVWDLGGRERKRVADLPLAEAVPTPRDACRLGPRDIRWRADHPAALCWVEALDGGDPLNETEERDQLWLWEAPFAGKPAAWMTLGMRFAGAAWSHDDLALVTEQWWATRRKRVWMVAPGDPDRKPQSLFDLSSEDAYGDPGDPLTVPNARGERVLQTDASRNCLFLRGEGASPDGDRPFVDRFDLNTRQATRVWLSAPESYESPVALLDAEAPRLLITHETPAEPPSFRLWEPGADTDRTIISFPHPYPGLPAFRKELIHYRRKDGVALSATLYLPAEHRPEHGPLPMLVWAYPREFKSADAASQVKGSPYRFNRIDPLSPLPLLTQGFAVLDGPAMPIVGEGDSEPNDRYVEQLTAGAEAAVDEVVRMGVAARDRIAIGGHSYGGFMTANLLAHSRLFRCGIARSGAYNRTLTPFGFQAEERNLWEATEVYKDMSPFINAQRIEAPLLLVHGEADDNSGTFPIQSERLFNALKGLGKTARLVMLPHESHRYRARESILHTMWEMWHWLCRCIGDKE